MKFLYWAAAALASASVASAATAEEASCACPSIAGSPQGASGTVIGASGDVLISTKDGFSPATAGQSFGPGTAFILGCESRATIRVGADCALTLLPGTEVSLVPAGTGFCIRTAPRKNLCAAGATLQSSAGLHQGTPHFGLPEALFLATSGGILAGAAATELGSGNTPASP